MITELKELLTVIEKLPAMTMWVLGGFAVYKLIMYLSTTGAAVLLLKLAIEKLHDYKTRPPAPLPPRAVNLEGIFITADGTYERFKRTLEAVRDGLDAKLKYPKTSRYLHSHHVDFIVKALEEKIERDGLPKTMRLSEALAAMESRT